jgi:hypothetical protein
MKTDRITMGCAGSAGKGVRLWLTFVFDDFLLVIACRGRPGTRAPAFDFDTLSIAQTDMKKPTSG